MFNSCRYLLLFVTNLSLAITIFSCSDFSMPGNYRLDKAIINDKEVFNVEIDITTPAKNLTIEPTDYGLRSDYVLEGTILTNQIQFKYCTDLKSEEFPKIFLTNDLKQDKVSSTIDITASEIITYKPPTVSLPEELNTIDTYESGKVPMLNRDITKNNISLIPVGPPVNHSEDKKHGTKRKCSDGSDSNRESKHHKNESYPDKIDCYKLKPGRYKLHDREDLNILIISSVYIPHKYYSVKGFLKYSNFFSVPIYRYRTDSENLIFSVARRLTKTMRNDRNFTEANSIEYKVPKIKFIDKNFTNDIDKGQYDSLNDDKGNFNIGCSILYDGFILNKKTFNLKENLQINIINMAVSVEEKFRQTIYNLVGTITIDGLSYEIYDCERDYDKDNDSKIIYYKNDYLYFFRFNILDLLPSLTS